jgi:alkanesulfonate monooxygenase
LLRCRRLWDLSRHLSANATALVGTPEQVAEVFGDYYDLGMRDDAAG